MEERLSIFRSLALAFPPSLRASFWLFPQLLPPFWRAVLLPFYCPALTSFTHRHRPANLVADVDTQPAPFLILFKEQPRPLRQVPSRMQNEIPILLKIPLLFRFERNRTASLWPKRWSSPLPSPCCVDRNGSPVSEIFFLFFRRSFHATLLADDPVLCSKVPYFWFGVLSLLSPLFVAFFS